MTILGIPEGSGFAIGTSSNIVPSASSHKMDMSLDDMIKSRRSAKPAASTRAATTADRTVAKGKAKRTAAANARRGIATTDKPTAQQVEKEISRQTRRATSSTKKIIELQQGASKGRKPRSQADIKTKARQTKKSGTMKRESEDAIPPTWIGGTRRPPSKKAIVAAVEAMQESGFKVPKGMQMVISFAPAPDYVPPGTNNFQGANTKNTQPYNNRGNNNNSNSAKKQPNPNIGNNNGNNAGGRNRGGRGGRRPKA